MKPTSEQPRWPLFIFLIVFLAVFTTTLFIIYNIPEGSDHTSPTTTTLQPNPTFLERVSDIDHHILETLEIDETRRAVSIINAEDFQKILKPILVERTVGSEGHADVQNYIVDAMLSFRWSVELDNFTDNVNGKDVKTFTNIIASRDGEADRHLVLACHYDSKIMPFPFVGATDSAVPCAMLIYLADILNNHLAQYRNTRIGLKFIFFDGEEAFVNWSETDSLYGARHLARKMEQTPPAFSSRNVPSTAANQIEQIDLLILLDLLGAASPTFYNYFENTKHWYRGLAKIEQTLTRLALLEPHRRYFDQRDWYTARIDDDHIPFMRKGVPVVHIIPHPFPYVWHTTGDNENIVHMPTVKNLLMIFELFLMEYLNGTAFTPSNFTI